MKVRIGIWFCSDDGERFFGEGPRRLLRGVEELGSLRAAAGRMGMAYTKAFAILKRAERELGFPLTTRKIGGKGGGGSLLTPMAKELLARYDAYETACCQLAQNLYQEHFEGFGAPQPSDHRQPGDRQDHSL